MQQAVASGDLLGYSELNQQLHALIRTLGGQATAQAILERLRGQNVRHRFRLALHPGRAAVSLPQHLEIIDALCAGDADGGRGRGPAAPEQRDRHVARGRRGARAATSRSSLLVPHAAAGAHRIH